MTIPHGQYSQTIILEAKADGLVEGLQKLEVTISNGLHYDGARNYDGENGRGIPDMPFDNKLHNPGNYFARLNILDGITLFAGSIAQGDSNYLYAASQNAANDLRDSNGDIDPNDVDQGNVMDCFLMTTMLALAKYRPDLLQANISQVGNTGTFLVNLWNDGESTPTQELVELDLTQGFDTASLSGDYETTTGNVEVWTLVLERAFVQRFFGGIMGNVSGGSSSTTWTRLTGLGASDLTPNSDEDVLFNQIADNWDPPNGKYVIVGTVTIPPSTLLTADHAYLVSDVDRNNGMITLLDPWDPSSAIKVISKSDLPSWINSIRLLTN